MIHYSCDCCKRKLDPEEELRYVVKLEAFAAMNPLEDDELDDERDHLLEIEEILERIEEADGDLIGDDVYQKRRYDLCAACYKNFAKNPLGREASSHFDFSNN